MVGRVPCGVCNLQSSSPNNFLLVCACGIACHHRCLKPPMAHSSLLMMIEAFTRSIHEKSIRAWRCAACISTTSKLRNQWLPPISAEPPTFVDKEVRYNPGCHDKNMVSGRAHERRKYAPAPVKPSQSRLHMNASAAAWPPVRHKNKIHTHPSVAEDIWEPIKETTSPKMNVAPTKQVDGTKSLVKLHSPATKGAHAKPKHNLFHASVFSVKTPPTYIKSRVLKPRDSVDGTLASSYPGGSTSAQATAAINKGHTVPPSIHNSVVNYSHVGENISKIDHLRTTSNTLPRNGNGVNDIFIDYHPGNSADLRTETVTQVSFPVLPFTNARGLYDFPSSPTAPRRPNKRKRLPDAVIPSKSGKKAGHTPSVTTPPRWGPPFIDLHKALKRKRSTVRHTASATSTASTGNNPGVPKSKWDAANGSMLVSGFDEYLLKRRKLDIGNTEKPEIQTSGGRVSIATQKQNEGLLAAVGKHITNLKSPLPPDARTDGQFQEFPPINRTKRKKLDVQTCQTIEPSHPQLHPPDTEIRDANADHPINVKTNETIQMTQLASPATSHRSAETTPSNDSPLREANPVPPSVTFSSLPEKILPTHDQIVSKSHTLPTLSLLTPRSLSPSRHPDHKSVLDDVVARLQLQRRHHDCSLPQKLPESKVKFPQLAKWFKELGTNLTSTGTRDKRKRWKTPNPKAMMVGLSEGWTFVGTHVRPMR